MECPLFILLPWKRPDQVLFKKYQCKAVLSFASTAWINQELSIVFLNKSLKRDMFELSESLCVTNGVHPENKHTLSVKISSVK